MNENYERTEELLKYSKRGKKPIITVIAVIALIALVITAGAFIGYKVYCNHIVNKALDLDPKVMSEQDYDDAITVLERALYYQPDNVDIHRKMAEVYVKNGHTKDAIEKYKMVAKTTEDEKDWDAYNNLISNPNINLVSGSGGLSYSGDYYVPNYKTPGDIYRIRNGKAKCIFEPADIYHSASILGEIDNYLYINVEYDSPWSLLDYREMDEGIYRIRLNREDDAERIVEYSTYDEDGQYLDENLVDSIIMDDHLYCEWTTDGGCVIQKCDPEGEVAEEHSIDQIVRSRLTSDGSYLYAAVGEEFYRIDDRLEFTEIGKNPVRYQNDDSLGLGDPVIQLGELIVFDNKLYYKDLNDSSNKVFCIDDDKDATVLVKNDEMSNFTIYNGRGYYIENDYQDMDSNEPQSHKMRFYTFDLTDGSDEELFEIDVSDKIISEKSGLYTYPGGLNVIDGTFYFPVLVTSGHGGGTTNYYSIKLDGTDLKLHYES